MRVLIVIAALALAAPVAAQSPAGTSLTLADAATAPTGRVIIDGAGWTCDDTGACTAFGGQAQPAERACRRAVARLGAVTAFSWKGQALSAEQIAACNASAN